MRIGVYTKISMFISLTMMFAISCVENKKSSIAPNMYPIVQAEPFQTIIRGKSKFFGQQSEENNSQFARVSNSSPHERFIRIKINPEIAANEIDFWVRQLSEHALFLHLGLEDKKLKKEAFQLHTKFEHFRRKFNAEIRDMCLMNSVLPLIEKEREFKVRVLNRLEAGEWLGWLFPLFVNHIILELDYLVDKLNGVTYSFSQELQFWNRVNSEHALFASHFLDPKERSHILVADAVAQKLNQTNDQEYTTMLQLSLNASKELDAFNKQVRASGNGVQSIIHPVLLDHVIREGERSIKTLSAFPKTMDEVSNVYEQIESGDMLSLEDIE